MLKNTKISLFMELSRHLTGENKLLPGIARECLDEISKEFGEQALGEMLQVYETLVKSSGDVVEKIKIELMMSEKYGDLIKEIIMIWYTGQFSINGQLVGGNSKLYDNGLMWKFVKAHAPGVPGGVYGYWAKKPGVDI